MAGGYKMNDFCKLLVNKIIRELRLAKVSIAKLVVDKPKAYPETFCTSVMKILEFTITSLEELRDGELK